MFFYLQKPESTLSDSLINKGKEIILLGDLNIDMSCEDILVKNELCDIYDLYNIISEPTCFRRPEGTLIDPIIVRSKKRFKKSINVFFVRTQTTIIWLGV